MNLRDYQQKAINAAYDAFRDGKRRPLIVIPTGGGKSPVLASFIKNTIQSWPDTRILCLVHVKELVEQNYRTLKRIWPEAPVSVYSAGLKKKDLSGQVIIGSIQSLYKRAYDLQKVDIVIVDEAHLIPASGDGMYRKLLDDLAKINGGDVPVLGLTATPFRLSSGSLVEGEGKVFDSICHEVGLKQLIDRGYLVTPVTKAGLAKIDTSRVHTRAGEFMANELQAAADRADLVTAAVAEIVEAGADRKSWLCFSTGVDHAFHIRDAIREHGITCETVTGDTPHAERDRIIRDFKAGKIRCITNDSVLTTGFDHPPIDLLAVLRPTQSPGLWLQMVGRGTRLFEGKENCLVLDFGGNAVRHGALDQIKGRPKGEGGPAPQKECPECHLVVPAGTITCSCGYVWEIERRRAMHDAKAAAVPLLSGQVSDWIRVKRVTYHEHRKPGKPPSLRVSYLVGIGSQYSEWVCFEHDGPAAKKAQNWWFVRARSAAGVEPRSVQEALQRLHELSAATFIKVRFNGQHWNVVDCRFDASVETKAA
ncbi:MAG: hypothetical protein K0R61_741 [Microvirga sp.]|jgi:DNA repair protein RadD|nr:hypothetical protein [Microvirga sp.]